MLRTSLSAVMVALFAGGATLGGYGVMRTLDVHMHGAEGGAFRVVASRMKLDGTAQYQDELSVYNPKGRLVYRSPGNGAQLLARLEKAHGAPSYFPHQTLTVLGAARLMGTPAQQAVVAITQVGADCGTAIVAVIGGSARIAPLVRVTNPCDLHARIAGRSIVLTGPFYAASAPLYRPTKNRAVATLRYQAGRWVETPRYFKLDNR